MRKGFLKISTALVALGLSIGAAGAADWEGAYIGLSGGSAIASSAPVLVGVQVGYNFSLASGMVAGVELNAVAAPELDWNGFAVAQGRLGYEVTPDFLLYGFGGAGMSITHGTSIWAAGIGAQYAFSEAFSLRADYTWIGQLGGGETGSFVMAGVTYSF